MPFIKYSQLLTKVNFPLYTVQCLNEDFILVAGGGGRGRSGIRNAIEVYQLINNEKICQVERVAHYETENEAIMNCTVFNTKDCCVLFSGKDGNCQIYEVKWGTNFEIKSLESFQTDFSEEPFQKLVRFSKVENILATGGADGHIRLWKYPKLNQIVDIEAHIGDLNDMDFCPMGKLIVSASKDGHCRLWCTEDGSLISELEYFLQAKTDVRYIFRSCRFGIVGYKNDFVLFTTQNPSIRKKPPLKCYICKYETRNFTPLNTVSTGTDVLSNMTISDDGRFIGLGCESGSVKIYTAFNLQLLYNMENIHGIFVTCIQFLPSTKTCQVTDKYDASLISVSVDNKIIIHNIPMRASMNLLTPITLLILTLFLVFVISDFFNL